MCVKHKIDSICYVAGQLILCHFYLFLTQVLFGIFSRPTFDFLICNVVKSIFFHFDCTYPNWIYCSSTENSDWNRYLGNCPSYPTYSNAFFLQLKLWSRANLLASLWFVFPCNKFVVWVHSYGAMAMFLMFWLFHVFLYAINIVVLVIGLNCSYNFVELLILENERRNLMNMAPLNF